MLTFLLALSATPVFPARCDAAPRRAEGLAPITADSGVMYRGSLSRDGRTLYYFKKVTPGREDYRVFVTRFRDGAWSTPERLNLGGDHSELYPSISADGNRLVFSSYVPIPSDTFSYKNAHLWYVDRAGSGWGKPVFMAGATELGHYHSGPTIRPDGSVRFRRTTPDWRTQVDLITRWRDGAYRQAEPDTLADRWKGFRPDLHVWSTQLLRGGQVALIEVAAKDQLTGRPGQSDLWFATRRGDGWTEPRPLGAGVNTEAVENFAFLAPDDCRLVFTRGFSSLQQVSLDAAIADAQPAPGEWAARGPHETVPALTGSYRGAFARDGSVQLLEATIAASGDSLLLSLSTPDRLSPFRPVRISRQGTQLTFPSEYGVVTAQLDPAAAEIVGTATDDGVTTTVHLKRSMAAPPVPFKRENATFASSGGVTLAGTIVTPLGIPITAGVAYVAGRSCGGRGSGLRVLEVLARYGVAGIAIDKRGVGQSTGNCQYATISQFSDDALAALDQLRGRLDPTTPVGFLGNSAGGWVSVHAAARAPKPIDFLITTVGPATSVKQQQLDATEEVARGLGLTADQVARAKRYVELMFAPGPTQAQYDEMTATVAWARGIGFAQAFFEPSDIPTSVAGIDSLWVRLNDYDPGPDLARLRIPILAFYGGADVVVPPASNAGALRRITAAAGNDRVRIVVAPEGDHALYREGGTATAGDRHYWRFERISPLFFEEVLAFIRRL